MPSFDRTGVEGDGGLKSALLGALGTLGIGPTCPYLGSIGP